MWIRLTVDDALTIQAVEAVTDAAPYGVCPSIAPNFQRLVGLAIKPGFTARVKQLLGGVEGCTHLVDLLGPVRHHGLPDRVSRYWRGNGLGRSRAARRRDGGRCC